MAAASVACAAKAPRSRTSARASGVNSPIRIATDDTVFTYLAAISKEKDEISDFLTLFYYFITCYARLCFRKNAIWYDNKSYRNFRVDYGCLEVNKPHEKIKEIQTRMRIYRQEYKLAFNKGQIYLTSEKQRELELFIKESLIILCTDIEEPILDKSPEIRTIISKYQDEIRQTKKHKKSPKLNYAVLAEIGIELTEDDSG
jgi:hypothetical protein